MELESDLQDTGWCKKWFVHFISGKTQLVLFDWPNNNGSIDVKMNGSVFAKKNHLLRCWICPSKLDWGPYIISIAKTAKKTGALIPSMKILSREVALYLYKSTIHPCMEYCCVTSGLVPRVATGNC